MAYTGNPSPLYSDLFCSWGNETRDLATIPNSGRLMQDHVRAGVGDIFARTLSWELWNWKQLLMRIIAG